MAGNVGKHILQGWFGLGGARALSAPDHVTLQGLNRDREIFCRICVSEAWPGGKISCFDGRKPSGAHRESCKGMQVTNKGAHAWKVVRIRGNRSGDTCSGQGGVSLRAKGESPQSGATWLTRTAEEDVVVPRVNGDHLFSNRTRQPWSHNVPMPIRL